MKALIKSLVLGLLSGVGATEFYAISAVVVAVRSEISTEWRVCHLLVHCGPIDIAFGFVFEPAMALIDSLTVFGVPIVALVLTASAILGGIEMASAGHLSNRIVILYSFGVAVLIAVIFEFAVGVKVATYGLGEYYLFGTVWEVFARFWRGLPIVLYVIVTTGLGWFIHSRVRSKP